MFFRNILRGLHSIKCSSEMLQNLLYFMNKKTMEVFFSFHFMRLTFFTILMPWPINAKLHEMKNEKNYYIHGFDMYTYIK